MVLLLMVLLLAPKPGWSAKESAAEEKAEAAAGLVDEGRGQGFREEAETEKKGVDCPSTFGPIITDTAVPIEKGKFAIQPFFALGFLTNVFNRSWKSVSAERNFTSFQMNWRFTYGPIENMEIFVMIPYIHNWVSGANNPGPNGERSANFGGLGDIDLTLKYRLVEEGPVMPTVTAMFATDFPTGHFRHLNPRFLLADAIGGGAYIFTTGFNVSKCLNPVILYGNFWYSMSPAYTREIGRLYPRDFVTVNLAGEYVITNKWIALLEFTSFYDGGRLIGHKSNVPPQALVSLLPGIEYLATDKLSFALGVNIDVAGKTYPANITPILSMVYQF
jgi:hypothetical protein